MMGKVLVRKANPDATNLMGSLLGSGPKTRLGQALGGGLGGLSFLTRLATAGEQQQDAVSALGSAGLAAYGGYKGGAQLGDGVMDVGHNIYQKVNPMSETNVANRDAKSAARQQKKVQRRYPHLPTDEDGNLPTYPEGHKKAGRIDPKASGLAEARQRFPSTEGREGTKGDWDAWAEKNSFDFPQGEDSWMPSWMQDNPFRAGVIGKPSKSGKKQSVRGFKGWQPNLFDATATDFPLTTDQIDPATGKKKLTALGRRIEESKPVGPASVPMHAIQAGTQVGIAPPINATSMPSHLQGTAQMEGDMPSMVNHSMGGNEDGGHIDPSSAVAEVNQEAVAGLAGDPENEKLIQEFHEKTLGTPYGKSEPMDIAFLILKAVMK